MTSAHHLISDLNNLLAESKRRNSDIRKACEAALSDVQAGNASGSIDGLSDQAKSHILEPFIISCSTGNAKFANIAVPAINKLVLSKAVNVGDLKRLVAALDEASHLAIDIQLRILQCLPALMQIYSREITNSLLIEILVICAGLTSNNKSTVVINTASATLQQLFTNVFDKVPVQPSEPATKEISIDNSEVVKVDDLSYEGYMIFSDLCHLIENEECQYLEHLQIRQSSVLEIVESIINSHGQLFANHPELSYLLRVKIVPSSLRILNSSDDFALVVRTMRILSALLGTQLDNLVIESEIILSILNHIVINEDNSEWEKVLVLEIFNNIFSNFTLVQSIYNTYDANPKRKNLVQELFNVLNHFLQKTPFLISDILQVPSPQQPHLSKQHSTLKITILDHLDKHEPPASIPRTYSIHLIFNILVLFTDGIARFVNGLSGSGETQNLENDIEFINSIIERSYPDVSYLLKCFIYTVMDNDNFHLLIRSLQKFTHTTGLLGLNSLKDNLLIILGQAIIRNESDRVTDTEDVGNTSILQEQGKNLLALGESIVESLTSGEANGSSEKLDTIKSRNFCTRHVTCLRALINLAISLGSTLTDSWKIVWITLQWCDYYINGLNEFSGVKKVDDSFTLKVTQSELNSIQTSISKFFESIADYPPESYQSLIKEVISLNEIGLLKKSAELPLNLCPYNKIYFIDQLYALTKVDPVKFLIDDAQTFPMLSDFFISIGTIRNNLLVNPKLKLYVVEKFNLIIKNLTNEGRSDSDNDKNNKANEICLNGLNSLLNALISNGSTDELLVLNTEIDVHLKILETLYEVIDNCDKNLTEAWDIIFKIINSSFHLEQADSTVREKATPLIEASFNTLKMILNEFISTLPIEHFKLLIDTLYNFCEQSFDLNVSFSSISYFWLIGDSIKSKFSQSSDVFDIDTESKLISYIADSKKNDDTFFKCLDIYLMTRLITLTNDERAQVRDGALQTFFEIIDVHEALFNDKQWNLIFNIILVKIFEVKQLEVKEMKEAVTLKIDGLISIFTKHSSTFTFEFWKGFIDFFDNMVKLNRLELNVILFDKFNEILLIDLKNNPDSDRIVEEFFNFWIGIPIEYDFNQPELYIDSLTRLLKIFQNLYQKVELDEKKIQLVLNNFSKSVRYPIIVNRSDDTKPTVLQSTVIENFKAIDSSDDKINSNVIRELSNILVYQFVVRERIESKFKNSNLKVKYKTPTFIAIGSLSFQLIVEKFSAVKQVEILLHDKTISKLIRSLLEVIENKTSGNEEGSLLWVSCYKFLATTLSKVFEGQVDDEIWDLALKSVSACFACQNKQEESAGIDHYKTLSSIVIPKLKEKRNIGEYIKILYENSYLYEFNEIEGEIMQNQKPEEALFAYDFDESFGSTKPTVFFKFNDIRFHSLEQLIDFANQDDFQEIASEYFITRIAFTIRRLIEEERLVYKMPSSIVREREFSLLLSGLAKFLSQQNQTGASSIGKLMDFLIQTIPFSHKFGSCRGYLEQILIKYNARA